MSVFGESIWPRGRTRRWLLLAAVLAVAAALAGIALLAVSGWLITATGLVGLGLWAMLDIFAPGAVIRAAALIRTLARYLERLIGHDATFRHLARLRVAAAEGLLRLPLGRLAALRSGDSLSRLTRDIDLLDHGLTRLVLPLAAAVVTTLAVIVWLAWREPRLGALIAASYLLAGVALLWATQRVSRHSAIAVSGADTAMRTATADWGAGRAELFSLDRAADFGAGVLGASRSMLAAQRRQRRVEALAQFALTLIGYLAFFGVLKLALAASAAGRLSAPLVVAMALVAWALVELWLPLVPGVGFLGTMKRCAGRVEQLLRPDSTSPARSGGDGERPAGLAVEAISDRPVERTDRPARIEIRDLHFRHAAHLPELFGGLDLVIEPGERILLEGPSGCGKSTLLELLAGIREPQRGAILYAGLPLSQVNPKDLRRSIGYLTQTTTLFSDTLASNLRLADPEASESRLHQALARVELGELADSLPEGLDTWIGEFGQALSGGQGRRVALARMVLADFRALLLDEPGAGLDESTARRMWRSLEPWLAARSLVLCAHDVAALPRIDRRLVCQPGRGWCCETGAG